MVLNQSDSSNDVRTTEDRACVSNLVDIQLEFVVWVTGGVFWVEGLELKQLKESKGEAGVEEECQERAEQSKLGHVDKVLEEFLSPHVVSSRENDKR